MRVVPIGQEEGAYHRVIHESVPIFSRLVPFPMLPTTETDIRASIAWLR